MLKFEIITAHFRDIQHIILSIADKKNIFFLHRIIQFFFNLIKSEAS